MCAMIENSGICAFPDCTRSVAPPPVTGGRSRYCDDAGHNPTTAYRAKRRPAARESPGDPVVLREHFERDLDRLERTLSQAREIFAAPDTSARLAELERELAAATEARRAAEAALAPAVEQAREATERAELAETTDRQWFAEAATRIERAERERDGALARLAEAEAGRRTAEDRAYAAESAWRTLDRQLAEQLDRAERAETALKELGGEAQPSPEDRAARQE
jgi:colicin import membrane protein